MRCLMKLLITILTMISVSFGAFGGIFHDTPVGKKNDVILEMWSDILNEWDEVILVFGYNDDYEVCEDIKKLFKNRYNRRYRCTTIK